MEKDKQAIIQEQSFVLDDFKKSGLLQSIIDATSVLPIDTQYQFRKIWRRMVYANDYMMTI